VKEQPIDSQSTIRSRVGNRVSFRYPGDEGEKTGVLKDRTVVPSITPPGAVPYWDVIDLLEFEGQSEPWMRIGYYRKPKDRLNWGSQTTITEPLSVWKRLMVTAARDKKWFRDLLDDVIRELQSQHPAEEVATAHDVK
jgi:hypothetical protein